MIIVLFLLPVFMGLSLAYLYRFTGRKQILRFDLVQFVYAFLAYPLGYIWVKSILFFLLRQELGISLTFGQWNVLDTFFSLIFMYFYAFGIIHSLTKTFSLEMERDPLIDLFSRSEYFHELFSHIGMYAMGLVTVSILGSINLFFPVFILMERNIFLLINAFGILVGLIAYIAMFQNTVFEGSTNRTYRRALRLVIALCFSMMAIFYFVSNPNFRETYILYWFTIDIFIAMIGCFFLVGPLARLLRFFTGPKDL